MLNFTAMNTETGNTVTAAQAVKMVSRIRHGNMVSYEFPCKRDGDSTFVDVAYGTDGSVEDLFVPKGCYEEVRYTVPAGRKAAMLDTLKKAGLI